MKYNHTWEEVENAGRLYNVEFSIDFTVTPYRPAKINCDPDDGYPAEGGEVNINEIKVLWVQQAHDQSPGPSPPISPGQRRYWTERFEKEQFDDDFKIELAEHAAADEEAAREAEDDSRYDTMRERDE